MTVKNALPIHLKCLLKSSISSIVNFAFAFVSKNSSNQCAKSVNIFAAITKQWSCSSWTNRLTFSNSFSIEESIISVFHNQHCIRGACDPNKSDNPNRRDRGSKTSGGKDRWCSGVLKLYSFANFLTSFFNFLSILFLNTRFLIFPLLLYPFPNQLPPVYESTFLKRGELPW